MAGVLDYALQTNLNVDDTGNTFAGTINGGMKVYIDPYSANDSDGSNTTVLVTKVLTHTMLDCSTVHMYSTNGKSSW